MITGIAWCQLKLQKDPKLARDTLSQITEAQVKDMKDEFWNDLLFKIDEEIQALETKAAPDENEYNLLKQIDSDPRNLDLQFELVGHLIGKGRLEDSIPVLLNILAVDRNYGQKKAHTQLMDVFAKLGSTSEAVKKGRKKLASIMF